MNCPNCKKVLTEDAAECLGCGVILSKWTAVHSRPPGAKTEPDSPLAAIGPLVPLVLTIIAATAGAAWHYRSLSPFNNPVSISSNEVRTTSFHGYLSFRFTKGESFSDSFFLFGADDAGETVPERAIFGALPSESARDIYRRYPDFYQCASPGAKEGEEKSTFLRLIPADGGVAATIKDVIGKLHVQQGTDRIALRMTGHKMTLASAIFNGNASTTWTIQYPDGKVVALHAGDNTSAYIQATDGQQKYRHEYVLVESAEIIPGKRMLDSP